MHFSSTMDDSDYACIPVSCWTLPWRHKLICPEFCDFPHKLYHELGSFPCAHIWLFVSSRSVIDILVRYRIRRGYLPQTCTAIKTWSCNYYHHYLLFILLSTVFILLSSLSTLNRILWQIYAVYHVCWHYPFFYKAIFFVNLTFCGLVYFRFGYTYVFWCPMFWFTTEIL